MESDNKPFKFTKKKLLAVEGKDEINFFNALFKHMKIGDSIDRYEVGGKVQFKNKIPAMRLIPGYNNIETIAIIRDADESPASAFESVKGILGENKLQSPKRPGEFSEGNPSEGNPKVGVFIMPDNKNSGMLETLCMDTVKNEEGMKCVDRFIDCANELNEKPMSKDIDKARARAFLAIKPETYEYVGLGAQKRYWNFDAEELNPLKDFLNQLR